MITALYFLILGIASGLVGLWCRRLLAELGLLHGFEATLLAAAFIAVAYITSQVAFRAAVMIVKPARARSLDVTEILSQCAALLLAPSLAGFTLPIPYASLQRFEPLFHLAAFASVHGFFKFMAFFAALQGPPVSRIRALPWMAFVGISCLCGYAIVEQYLQVVQAERPLITAQTAPFAIANSYARAFPVPENVRVAITMEEGAGDRISLFCAPHWDQEQFPDTVSIAIDAFDVAIDEESETSLMPLVSLKRTFSITEDDWTELVFDRSDFPEDAIALSVSWSIGEPDSIKQFLGLTQAIDTGRTMMISGPWRHTITTGEGPSPRGQSPGIVILVIEALGAENMNLYGYHRDTVPFLIERAASMVIYEEAYTPAPETAAACMSLLTGLNPLAHRYYESFAGPLPDGVRTLPEALRDKGYHTVAFTEGRGTDKNDLYYGSGFERGFILFDDSFPLETRPPRRPDTTAPARPVPAGAWVTLRKAGDWIENHADTQYLVFIRLRELRSPAQLPRYGDIFIGRGRTPDPIDVYDTAITYVDKQVSAFIDRLYSLPEGRRPVLVLTSSHGFDFTEPGRGAWRRGGPPRRTLHESVLRIPLLLDVPERYGSTQKHPVSLEDVAVTLATLAGATLPNASEGVNILASTSMRERISMTGDPVALSMRAGRWRFTWQSGQSPYAMEQVEPPAIIEFVDVTRGRSDLAPVDNIRREPQLVEAFTQQLRSFLSAYQQTGAVAAYSTP